MEHAVEITCDRCVCTWYTLLDYIKNYLTKRNIRANIIHKYPYTQNKLVVFLLISDKLNVNYMSLDFHSGSLEYLIVIGQIKIGQNKKTKKTDIRGEKHLDKRVKPI